MSRVIPPASGRSDGGDAGPQSLDSAEADAIAEAFNAAYCRPYGPLTERDDAYWNAPISPGEGDTGQP